MRQDQNNKEGNLGRKDLILKSLYHTGSSLVIVGLDLHLQSLWPCSVNIRFVAKTLDIRNFS